MQPVMTPHLRELFRWSSDRNAGPREERRYTRAQFTIGGAVEHRTAHHARRGLSSEAASFQARLDALERQSRELLEG